MSVTAGECIYRDSDAEPIWQLPALWSPAGGIRGGQTEQHGHFYVVSVLTSVTMRRALFSQNQKMCTENLPAHRHTVQLPVVYCHSIRGSSINGRCTRRSTTHCADITAWCRQNQAETLLMRLFTKPHPPRTVHSGLEQVASHSSQIREAFESV